MPPAPSTDIVACHQHQIVGPQLLAGSVGNKTSLAGTLKRLHDGGLLEGPVKSLRTIRGNLQRINATHADARTPYGTVVKIMAVPGENFKFEYVCPFAYLHHMCTLSSEFTTIMKSCSESGNPLRIVLYADSICPGNPFRPEKSRTVQCIYWTIIDWPPWMLQRSGLWPVFGFIRDTILNSIDGGLGKVMGLILRLMFFPSGVAPSFQTGIVLPGGFMVTAMFAGFLADLVAHKDLFQFKGASGFKFCFECGNVVNRRYVDSPCGRYVGIGCHR